MQIRIRFLSIVLSHKGRLFDILGARGWVRLEAGGGGGGGCVFYSGVSFFPYGMGPIFFFQNHRRDVFREVYWGKFCVVNLMHTQQVQVTTLRDYTKG